MPRARRAGDWWPVLELRLAGQRGELGQHREEVGDAIDRRRRLGRESPPEGLDLGQPSSHPLDRFQGGAAALRIAQRLARLSLGGPASASLDVGPALTPVRSPRGTSSRGPGRRTGVRRAFVEQRLQAFEQGLPEQSQRRAALLVAHGVVGFTDAAESLRIAIRGRSAGPPPGTRRLRAPHRRRSRDPEHRGRVQGFFPRKAKRSSNGSRCCFGARRLRAGLWAKRAPGGGALCADAARDLLRRRRLGARPVRAAPPEAARREREGVER